MLALKNLLIPHEGSQGCRDSHAGRRHIYLVISPIGPRRPCSGEVGQLASQGYADTVCDSQLISTNMCMLSSSSSPKEYCIPTSLG